MTVPPDFRVVLKDSLLVSAEDAVFRDNTHFMAGSLSRRGALQFWQKEILQLVDSSEREKILLWLGEGVKVEDFLRKFSEGRFRNIEYASKYPAPQRFNNYVQKEHVAWVSDEIHRLLEYGAVRKWVDCVGMGEHPVIIAPIQVEVEKTKNRLIYNAQYLNCFMNAPAFNMDGVGKIAEIGWEGMFMFSIDHKHGYFHCKIHESSWKYFGFEWEGHIYVFVVLCFGWSPAPFIYSMLTEKVACYVRKVTIAPLLTWIDDNWGANAVSSKFLPACDQLSSARRVCYVTLMIMFHAGYFVNINKSVLEPHTLVRHLGIMVDSVVKKFFVPQDRVDEIVSIIERMLVEGFCTLRMLEKCVGKCRSMAIAVPCAILYTRAQYAALASNLDHKGVPRIARNKTIHIQPGSELAQELNMWLQLQTKLVNGAVWMEASKVYLNLHAFTDASSRRWGGLFRSPSGIFRMGGDFSEKEVGFHINEKEAVALGNSLELFCTTSQHIVKGKTVVVNVDNQTLYFIYENGGSTRQQGITQVCKKLFWLQIEAQFRLQLQWIPSGDNEADGITRECVDDDIRLYHRVFTSILNKWGGVFRDLMASSGNVQLGLDGQKLPFFSRYQDKGALGTDVFAQNISRDRQAKFPDFCFPPLRVAGKFLKFAEQSKAWCVVVIPEKHANWAHLTKLHRGQVLRLAEKGQQGKLLKFRNNALRTFCSKYAMLAVELDFR